MKSSQKGFTLVELIVVIGIIGILSTLGMSNYADILAKSRDTKRKSDLREVALALEQYYAVYGTYRVDGGAGYTDPKCGCGWLSREDGGYYRTSVTQALYDEGFLERNVVEDMMQSPGYMIYLCEGGQVYALSATLEKPTDADIEYAQYHTCNGGGDGVSNTNGTVTRYKKNFAITNKTY